jgi:hypothetical protein
MKRSSPIIPIISPIPIRLRPGMLMSKETSEVVNGTINLKQDHYISARLFLHDSLFSSEDHLVTSGNLCAVYMVYPILSFNLDILRFTSVT